MGTFDELSIGDVFASPARTLSEADVATLIAVGGYTHPLFTDPAYAAASPFGRTPVPGEGILHLMGGLVEQTERFDDTVIALVGLDEVRFRAPAFAGDVVRCEIEVLAKEPKGERGLLTMAWRCVKDGGPIGEAGRARNAADEVLCEARALMLFRLS